MATTRQQVDLSERRMYLYHDGRIVNSYSVAVGEGRVPKADRKLFDHADRVEPRPVSPEHWGQNEKKAPDDPDNPIGGTKLFLESPDYSIHGTNASIRSVRPSPREKAAHGSRSTQATTRRRMDRGSTTDDGSTHVVDLFDPISIEIHD